MTSLVQRETFEEFTIGYRVQSPYRLITESDVLALGRFTNDTRGFVKNRADDLDKPLELPPLHTFSLGLCLLLQAEETYIPKAFVAFLGFKSIDFLGPALTGMVITSVAVVTELRPRNTTGEVVFEHETFAPEGRVLVRSEHSILVRKGS